jgi:hypothetical protein
MARNPRLPRRSHGRPGPPGGVLPLAPPHPLPSSSPQPNGVTGQSPGNVGGGGASPLLHVRDSRWRCFAGEGRGGAVTLVAAWWLLGRRRTRGGRGPPAAAAGATRAPHAAEQGRHRRFGGWMRLLRRSSTSSSRRDPGGAQGYAAVGSALAATRSWAGAGHRARSSPDVLPSADRSPSAARVAVGR